VLQPNWIFYFAQEGVSLMKQPIIYFWNAFLLGNLWTNVVKWPGLDTIFYIDFRFDTLQFRSIVIYLKRRCASVWWRFGRCVVGFFGKKRITSFSLRRFYRFSLFLIKLKFSFDGDWRLRKKIFIYHLNLWWFYPLFCLGISTT
jgi:hypothetical protein